MNIAGVRIFVWIFIAVISRPAFAKFNCETDLAVVTEESATAYRLNLIRHLAESKMPAVVRVHRDGSMIPVILLNSSNFNSTEIQKLIEDSMGMGVDISQGTTGGNDVDHGLARAGKYFVDIIRQGDGMNIDSSTGRTRYGSNELNYTAIRSRDWDTYMKRRDFNSRVQIELAYLASDKERQVSVAYHNMRRAGIINVVIESVLRFEKNWNPHGLDEPVRRSPRLMAGGCTTVNCFNNYMGTRIPAQIETMKKRIAALSNLRSSDVESLLKQDDVKEAIEKMQADLAVADWKDPKILQPDFVDHDPYLSAFEKVGALQKLESQKLVDVVSYLAAIRISRDYAEVIRGQGAHEYAGQDADQFDHWPRRFTNKRLELDSSNARAVALFIYSDDPGAAEALRKGTFEHLGAIWGYWKNGASPTGNETISLAKAVERIP